MIRIMMMIIAFSFLSTVGSAQSTGVEGTWQYVAYEFEGVTYEVPRPGLELVFQFHPNGEVNLKWFYDGEDGFCERNAEYEVLKENWLFQKITWVNPANAANCSQDTDMQMGRQTMTHFTRSEKQLFLELELGGKPLIYILNRVPIAGP